MLKNETLSAAAYAGSSPIAELVKALRAGPFTCLSSPVSLTAITEQHRSVVAQTSQLATTLGSVQAYLAAHTLRFSDIQAASGIRLGITLGELNSLQLGRLLSPPSMPTISAVYIMQPLSTVHLDACKAQLCSTCANQSNNSPT